MLRSGFTSSSRTQSSCASRLVTSIHWQSSVEAYMSDQPCWMPWFVHVYLGLPSGTVLFQRKESTMQKPDLCAMSMFACPCLCRRNSAKPWKWLCWWHSCHSQRPRSSPGRPTCRSALPMFCDSVLKRMSRRSPSVAQPSSTAQWHGSMLLTSRWGFKLLMLITRSAAMPGWLHSPWRVQQVGPLWQTSWSQFGPLQPGLQMQPSLLMLQEPCTQKPQVGVVQSLPVQPMSH
mmetsp:Transcript_1652/g.5868  ORF Transcript_1652/g.5868 Transcript_1652/m.5868 type:complete len:232 (-) Transcript_1652:188-883(-)